MTVARRLATPSSVNAAIKQIADVTRRADDAGALLKQPLAADRFMDFFALLPARADSARSWTLSRAEIEARRYDLKAVNPNVPADADARTPGELIAIIEERHREVAAAIAELKSLLYAHADGTPDRPVTVPGVSSPDARRPRSPLQRRR